MQALRVLVPVLLASVAATGPVLAQTAPPAPGIYALGLGTALSPSWGLRNDYSPGFRTLAPDPGTPGVASRDLIRSSFYADWFPFSRSGFRVVGGVNLNDTSGGPLSAGSSGSGLDGAAGSWVRVRNPMNSTYLGVGFSQLGPSSRGLGFFADMGVNLGFMSVDGESALGQPTLSSEGWRTQSNGWFGFSYLPSVSAGLIYRY